METLEKKVEVGMGATKIVGSDRYPATVVRVSKSGRTAWIKEDAAVRTDNNGQSENQIYVFNSNPSEKEERIFLNKNGRWHTSDYYQTPVSVGERRKYIDPGF